ncbi:histidine phosphatase family protein [Poriferisphaera sp. WC338]|uniref:histidine phosphatase family protein n=1 Tax=Poriferisphaera sp. WC338 TaxID=3425129 RepID=UPI003D816FC6
MANNYSQRVYLVRHGQTEWSLSGKHTGKSDIPLTDAGRKNAAKLHPVLAHLNFEMVLCSPLSRARETAKLAGFEEAITEPNLIEWDYGEYDGVTTAEIRKTIPGWTVFTHACPDGETTDQVGHRVDQVIEKVRHCRGDAILFAHGHVLRVLCSRWLNLPPTDGKHFVLGTASLNVLGYEHETPVIQIWNEHIH